MIYALAAIGALTIAVLLWRAFAPEQIGVSARRAPIAPDDDPEFLRKLSEQQRRRDEGTN